MPLQKVDEQHIINQSLKLFRQKSYYATSMSEIATACGLLKGSLYHYFDSKEELMKKVIQTVHNYFRDEVFSHAYNSKLSPYTRMKKLIDQSEDIFIHRENGCIMGNIGVETAFLVPEFSELIKEFFNDFFKAMEHIYQDKYTNKQAFDLAKRSVSEVEGAIMLARIYDDNSFLKNTHKRILMRLKD